VLCHKARLQRWNQQLNHCIDAVVRETLKLEKKQSIYRKLGFIYTKEVLWLLFAALFAKLFAKLFARDPSVPLGP